MYRFDAPGNETRSGARVFLSPVILTDPPSLVVFDCSNGKTGWMRVYCFITIVVRIGMRSVPMCPVLVGVSGGLMKFLQMFEFRSIVLVL